MEIGVLNSDLLESNYTVEFGLGTATDPIHLSADVHYTEEQLKSGQSCPKPKVVFVSQEPGGTMLF
jgi:hypothetical protein